MGMFRVIAAWWHRCQRSSMLLAAALACASAGASPVVSGETGPRWAMGPSVQSLHQAPGAPGDAGTTTLHELLTIEEGATMAAELSAVPLPESAPGHALAHGLLADLDTALRMLQEAGYDGGFVAPRETGQGAFLRVAQRFSTTRSGLY